MWIFYVQQNATKECEIHPLLSEDKPIEKEFVERKDVYDGTPKKLFVLLLEVFGISIPK